MSMLNDIRKQQRLRQAEGYLDLIFALSDRWPLTTTNRDRMAHRALEALAPLDDHDRFRGTVQYMRGLAYRSMEAYAEAVPPLVEATQLEPENFHIHLALAWCYKRVDRLDLAIDALEDGLEVAPREAILHYNLACYWSLLHDKRQALRHLKRSFELDADFRDKVAEENDFDPIRRDPEFQLLSSIVV